MREEVTITKISCDICGDSMDDPIVTESCPNLVQAIAVNVYYGERKKYLDICYNCSDKIFETIISCEKKK